MDNADRDKKPLSLPPDQYTIGWICALPCELRAARAMLDQEHEDLPHQSKNDDNSYILGSIKQHNIAMPVLPQYGTSSATSTIKSMKSTFPNLRFVLMVGIGGGIPSKTNDIRLGDVVVSLPDGKGGGVIQYDLGREEEGEFHRVGVMNLPPTLLLSTVNNLRSESSLGKTLSGYVEIAASKSEEPEEWTYLGTGQDQLFESDYSHIPGEDDCEKCCENAKLENLVNRSPRKATCPRLHYGNIGSGNTVMKTALKRDLIAEKENIICFDMEAAGLMNEFPCLVIRGISDYADSHKNWKWQPYAAVAAAAYARMLLLKIYPQAVERQKTIEEIGSRLEEVSDVVNKLHSMQRTQEHQAILDWLTPIDYALQQSHHFNRRQSGTGQWLLHSPEFKAWTETDRETLFCPGIPGAGKTILTSIVINDLIDCFQNDSNTGLAYLYCDLQRQDEQKSDDLLANVLKQLAQCHFSFPESLRSLHDYHQGRRTRPSFDEIWSTLQSVSALFSRVFIVVDALDECQSTDCRTRILSKLFDLQVKYNVKLFATSRCVAEITEKFEGSLKLPIRATNSDLKIYLDDRMGRLQSFIVQDPALQRKVEGKISERADGMFLFAARLMDSLAQEPTEGHLNRALDSLPEELNDTYEQAMGRIETLGRNSSRFAKRILSWVIYAKRLLSTTEIRTAVAVDPGQQGLEVGFVPSLETIGSLCAGLITIDTQRDVVRLVHQTTKEYFDQAKEKWFPSAETEIATICLTYLSFNVFADGFCKTDGKFEERLNSNRLYDYAARNWGYHIRKSSPLSRSLKDFLACDAKSEASSQALLAVKYSSSHTNYSQQVPRTMVGLHLAAYFGLREAVEYLLADGSFPNSRDSYYRTPLWWAAYEGHGGVVELLLTDDRIEPDSKDNYQRTPMSWAAAKGHHEVVKLLLARKGVDPNSRDNINKRTPLLRAAANGHEKVTRLLLAHPVDPNLNDRDRRTPLSWAVESGHYEVVRLILTSYAIYPDSEDKNGRTPLLRAVENGNDRMVALLLANDRVNPDSKDNDGRTPLRWAVEQGHREIANQLLTAACIDLNSEDKYGQTPVQRVIQKGDRTMAKLLLRSESGDLDTKDGSGQNLLARAAKNGQAATVQLLLMLEDIDADYENSVGRTPLSYAAANGHRGIVELLLANNGVNPDLKDRDGRTPLCWASGNGHSEVVSRLLANYAVNPDSEDNDGRTPVSWAAEKGHARVSRQLLVTGRVNLAAKDKKGWTPLQWAVWNQSKDGIKSIFSNTAGSPYFRDNHDWTPLMWAAVNGLDSLVHQLLNTGKVDADSTDQGSRTPLSWAAANGHEAVVRLLLESGADSNSADKDGRTPLSIAAENGDEAIVRRLLESGADSNSADKDGRTPLSIAAENGDEAIVRRLLESGAGSNSADKDGRTPLSIAAENGDEAVVRRLLENGTDLNSADKDGWTPLWWTVVNGYEAIASLLLHDGADPNARDKIGQTTLLHITTTEISLSTGFPSYSKKFQQATNNPYTFIQRSFPEVDSYMDKIGQTLLSHESTIGFNSFAVFHRRAGGSLLAAHEPSIAIVELLLRNGADPNCKDTFDWTPLLWASMNGHFSLTRLLLETGADPNCGDKDDSTPLLWATAFGYQATVSLLLEKGADPNCKTMFGWTPLLWAAANGDSYMTRLLLEKGADPNCRDKDDSTPLSCAASQANEATVRLLLENGADIDQVSAHCSTPSGGSDSYSVSPREVIERYIQRWDM